MLNASCPCFLPPASVFVAPALFLCFLSVSCLLSMSPCPLLCSLASVPVSCLYFLGPGPVNLHPLSVSLPPVVVSLPPSLFPCLLSPFLCLMFLLPPNPVSYLLSLFSRARPCLLASVPCFLVSCPCFFASCPCCLAHAYVFGA
jgi:hypothetical protein